MPPHDKNGWSEYEKLVLAELKRLNDEQGSLRKDLREETRAIRREVVEKVGEVCAKSDENSRAIAALKVSAGFWGLFAGALAGGIPSLVALIIYLLGKS